MTNYDFMLKLNRSLSPEEVEALYEAGCSDATVETGPLGTLLDFSRDAPSLAEAVISAVWDIEKVPGLRAVGVRCESIVSLADIAERAGVSREAVRLWSTGRRGPGDFPSPVLVTRSGEKGWDWQEVACWLKSHRDIPSLSECPASETIRVLCMADQVLAARQALRSEPDDAVRESFERLLQDA